MSHVRIAHQIPLVRPNLPHQPVHPHMPRRFPQAPIIVRNQRRHHHLPQHLPVLHPPPFPREYETYEDFEQAQEYEEFYYDPMIAIPDQYTKIHPQFSKQILTYQLFPNNLQTSYKYHVKYSH